MSIPKKIHYCWLSNERMPKEIISSIKSWEIAMPDYELVLWDKNKFDINSVPWVSQACSVKKWALASDYIRAYAIYNEGGIYLDSDVYVIKRMDDLLSYDFFSCFEWNNPTKIFKDVCNSDLDNIQVVGDIQIEPAIFGGIKGHPFLKDCMNWYENHDFILPGGGLYQNVFAPHIYSAILQKYGFRYIGEEQKLDNNMIIFGHGEKFISPFHNSIIEDINPDICAVHWHAAAWMFNTNPVKKIIAKMKQSDRLRKLLGKTPGYSDYNRKKIMNFLASQERK